MGYLPIPALQHHAFAPGFDQNAIQEALLLVLAMGYEIGDIEAAQLVLPDILNGLKVGGWLDSRGKNEIGATLAKVYLQSLLARGLLLRDMINPAEDDSNDKSPRIPEVFLEWFDDEDIISD